MKNFMIVSFLVIFTLSANVVNAVKSNDKETPPWMEDIKVKGRSTYMVPKGAKREVIGSQVVVEPPNEYVARRIYEIEKYLEERFTTLENNQNNIKKELMELKGSLKAIQLETSE